MTPEEFSDRIYEILHNGGGVQVDLLDGIRDEMVELLAQTRFSSEIGNGVVVAWDTCYRCKKHHLVCQCGSPQEPPYIGQWREEWLAEKERKVRVDQERAAEAERILARREGREVDNDPSDQDLRDAAEQEALENEADSTRYSYNQGAGRFENNEGEPLPRQPSNVENGLDAALAAVSEKENEQKENDDDPSDPGF